MKALHPITVVQIFSNRPSFDRVIDDRELCSF